MMTTGERIRNARQTKNKTQKQLGELAGIAEPTIRRYELGKLNPKKETLEKIAKALGVHWLDLIGDDDIAVAALRESIGDESADTAIAKGKKRAGDYLESLGLDTSPQCRIITALDQLNDEGQAVAVERVEELTEIPKYQRKETLTSPEEKPTEDK